MCFWGQYAYSTGLTDGLYWGRGAATVGTNEPFGEVVSSVSVSGFSSVKLIQYARHFFRHYFGLLSALPYFYIVKVWNILNPLILMLFSFNIG